MSPPIAESPPCLLLHGFTGSPAELAFLADRLVQAGCRVRVPLLPGHGKSPADLLTAGRQEWLATARGALLEEGGPVRLLGLSMGALLATCLAAEFPERTAALVLLAPAVRLTQPAATLAFLLAHFPWLVHRYRQLRIRPESDLRDPTLRATNPKSDRLALYGLSELHALQRQTLALAPAVRPRALVGIGRRDRTVSRAGILRLARRLGGGADLRVFDRSGHQLGLDFDREEVARAVLRHFGYLAK